MTIDIGSRAGKMRTSLAASRCDRREGYTGVWLMWSQEATSPFFCLWDIIVAVGSVLRVVVGRFLDVMYGHLQKYR